MGKKSKNKEQKKESEKGPRKIEDCEVSTDLATKVSLIAETIASDHTNSNCLLDVFTASQKDEEDVILACCKAFKDIFSQFMLSTKFLDARKLESERINDNGKGKSRTVSSDQDSEEIFNSWLLTQHSLACDVLCNHLDHESSDIQKCAFESLTYFLEVEGKVKTKGSSCDSKRIVTMVITQMINSEIGMKDLIQDLPQFLTVQGNEIDDLAVYALQCLKKHLKQLGSSPSDSVLTNTWHIIRHISSSSSPQLGETGRNLLTAVVCHFLRYKMPVKLYKDILTEISLVMAKMSSPLRLADFLTESFSIGGAISLLSLNALFILMHQYNLNYPDFYGKLYSMFQPQIFGAKYRSRFFHLADLFLSSTHLPAYLVAAFAKRLARLALHAPATAAQIAVPFILNLIKRHPACEVLLHRTDGKTELESDPFVEEASMSECHALESCLWELQTLENHFDPNLSTKAKKRTIREEDLSTYLNRNAQDIVEIEAKKIKQNVPVTFEKSTSLDLPSCFVI